MTTPRLLFISLSVALGGSACVDRAGEESKPANAAMAQPTPAPGTEPPSPEGELFRLAGTADVTNRFPSTVVVVAESSSLPGAGQRCSGVLLSPGLVLTAGHCVCGKQPLHEPGQEERFRVDGTTCGPQAIIETVIYDQPGPGKGLRSQRQEFHGRVQPHPSLEILLNREGDVVSSRADLAAIFLDPPVEQSISFVELAESDAQAQEPFVIVGYGSDERLGSLGGTRRFNETRVAAAPQLEGGRVRFEQPGRHRYKGESGGPCLRQNPRGWELIGISSRNLGKEPAFISTYPYRSWVVEQLRRTVRVGADAGP